MKKPFFYFDYGAATPLDPKVFEVMRPYFCDFYANASALYQFAQKSRQAIDQAREKTADILQCKQREIIFTSGGTESNNLFIRGAAEAYSKFGKHIIASKIEHDSVLKPLEYLAAHGFEVTYVDVGENGIVNPRDVAEAIRGDTIFVTIMYANNEIGTIQPIAEIGKIIESHKNQQSLPFFHTDACHAAPYLDISVKKLSVDSMTLNGGKIYGPKGAGALFAKESVEIIPRILGGGQEYRKRSGTENVPAIAGFAAALSIAQEEREKESKRLTPLRDELIDGIAKNIPASRLNGDKRRRLPNNINISFRGLEGESILFKLDLCGIAASAGSACSSGSLSPSHVIRALGLSEDWTHSATRFTLGRGTYKKDIDYLLDVLPGIIKELRKASPF